ncbi:sensor histidine kinase [Cohnella endophytica]|nr:sensor histidine kinase [Cohnella endophytica]
MRISTKMIVGYILLIVLPFMLFAVFVYYQLYEKMFDQYQLANQQNIELSVGSLESSLGKIESLQSIYQNNAALIDYIRGDFMEDRDLIYSYLKDISPAISFASLGEPAISSLTIFPKTKQRPLWVPGFQSYEEIHGILSEREISSLKPAMGLWKHTIGEDGLSLAYYHKIYSETYTGDLGIIQMKVKPELFENLLENLRAVHPGNNLVLLGENKEIMPTAFQTGLTDSQIMNIVSAVKVKSNSPFQTDNNHLLVNSVDIKRLGITVVEVNNRNKVFNFLRIKQLWVIGGGSLLLLLSAMYYLIVSSLTKRIILLSRHMRKVGQDSLGHPYSGHAGTDEIGFLISNYNAMIIRMDELVNRVQKVELLKKEADFKMLQAQIQPHFLYNTLETMRMLARSNKDYIVADMALSLGNLLRYSLTKGNDTTLREELEHVKAYIAIHQIRIPDLDFQLEIDDSIMMLRCPRFILQPLVENGMIHGLSPKRGSKRISIRINQEEGYATILVADNGVGISSEKLMALRQFLAGTAGEEAIEIRGMGIGLNNVSERMKAYFGQESEMHIDSTIEVGTACSLIILLKEEPHA